MLDSLCFESCNCVGFLQNEINEIAVTRFVLLLLVILLLMEKCPNFRILLLSFFECFDQVEACECIELVINLLDRQRCSFAEVSLRHVGVLYEWVNSLPHWWDVLEMLIGFLDFLFVHYYIKLALSFSSTTLYVIAHRCYLSN